MKHLVHAGILLVVLSSLVGAQVYSDSFDYKDGTTVPGWNESVGDFSILNKQLVSEHRFLWQYIVLDQFSDLNAGVQMTVITTLSTQFYQCGGGTLRYSTQSNVMCKIQDNNRSGDFDRCFVYDQPGSSNWADINPTTTRATVRFLALDRDLICQVDTDMDGDWDLTVKRQTTQTPAAGKPGIAALGGSIFDDFKYFNAVARIDPKSQPATPGNLVTIQLKGPANKLYQCACSFGNGGFPFDAGRRIPLDPDPLMFLSMQNPILFQSFNGRLDGNGDSMAAVQILNIPALKGQTFYLAMIVLDANAPSMVGNISNDVRVDIT